MMNLLLSSVTVLLRAAAGLTFPSSTFLARVLEVLRAAAPALPFLRSMPRSLLLPSCA